MTRPTRPLNAVRALAVLACAAATPLAPAPASAEPVLVAAAVPFADPMIEPNAPQACAPHAQDFSVPGLWLGHFTGGRLSRYGAAIPPALEWKDQYSCFPTRASCERWQRDNLRVFHQVQGYRTCVALRGGGIVIAHRGHHRHVVIAKY